jgi:hypothetical protein
MRAILAIEICILVRKKQEKIIQDNQTIPKYPESSRLATLLVANGLPSIYGPTGDLSHSVIVRIRSTVRIHQDPLKLRLHITLSYPAK